MVIFLLLLLVSVCGIFIRRYYITEKGLYLENLIVPRANKLFKKRRTKRIPKNEPMNEETQTLYNQAIELFKEGDFVKAERIFKDLVTQSPHEANFHGGLGRALYEQEKFHESLYSYLSTVIQNSFG